ncbi:MULTISPECIES: transposase domain-containing protein [Pseudomonas]|uniref:transposase domain-containing protein n=1 Tax=Pseudomonas TaxID=286 RepID=UPI001C475853|nr:MULTISPECIES: transposase domain-containing protein [Pseudomonas]
MRLARALELTHNFVSTPDSLEGLDSLLDPALVEQALEQAGVATLRKRRLPLEMLSEGGNDPPLSGHSSVRTELQRVYLGDPEVYQRRSADRSGNIPKYLAELHASASHYVLPHRREERIYPRAIRLKSQKYPIKNKNASQLN